MANILKRADQIIHERAEEKERMYGNMFETMERATQLYNAMHCNQADWITTDDMYKAMIAMKLARQAYHHKEDNLLDAIAYMGSWNDYIEEKGDETVS